MNFTSAYLSSKKKGIFNITSSLVQRILEKNDDKTRGIQDFTLKIFQAFRSLLAIDCVVYFIERKRVIKANKLQDVKYPSPMATSQSEPPATSANLLKSNSLQRQDEAFPEITKLWGSKRLLVATFMFFGYFYSFMLRGNLTIAMVEMTSNKTIVVGNQTIVKAPEFVWDSKTRGWILSLFSYGIGFACIGGYLSTKYGGVTVVQFGILVTAMLNMLSPLALRTNLYLFAVGRVAEGLLENFAYAGICDVWSRWIPKNELPKILPFGHSGDLLGAAVTFPICGFIAHHYGWPAIFYFSGSIAMVWCLLLFIYVRNDPLQDKRITLGELKYIRRSIKLTDRKTITYPWMKMFISKPVWALCFGIFAYSWAHITVVFCFPLYIKDITNKSTAMVGLLSGIPNYVNLIVAPSSGLLIYYLQNTRGFDSLKLQKSILVCGFSVGGLLFATLGFCNFSMSMLFFIIDLILLTVNYNLLQIMIVCISPDHAGLVAGIAALSRSLSSITSLLSMGFIVTDHIRQQWDIYFILTGAIMIIASAVIALFGSNEDQKWLSAEDKLKKCKYDRVVTHIE